MQDDIPEKHQSALITGCATSLSCTHALHGLIKLISDGFPFCSIVIVIYLAYVKILSDWRQEGQLEFQ